MARAQKTPNPRILQLQRSLLCLTYGELIDVAASLRDMVGDDDSFDNNDANAFAELLHNFAENYEA